MNGRTEGGSPTIPSGRNGGLSDLAVSPFGLPLALQAKELRVAWVGRTSTEDHQDPRQSLLRQLERSKFAMPPAWVIACHFYDVESGRMELEQRGQGTGYERFDIPIARAGGIADLLAEAKLPNRRFDVVICESMSRIARKMYETLSVERELERAEVPIFASNEPILLSGGRAQQILQRRINQSVAEYEVLNMLELSWGGTCTHIREGYNIGKPPYGYKANKLRHPNPAKAEKGVTKTRLEPDGACAETVTLIAKWRHHERLGCDTIADRLNQNLERHPPPQPPGRLRARGAWSKSSVAELLKNPKYTGYQVYNRRARRSRGARNKANPPQMWVWSTEPSHEPLIPKWMFDEINAAFHEHQRSRDSTDPQTDARAKHSYQYRRRVVCDCGRKMIGTVRPSGIYYRCHPATNNRGRPDKHAGHPATIYIREDLIATVVERFFSERVFGPHRRKLLLADIDTVGDTARREQQDRSQRLRRQLAELERKQDNVVNQAEDADAADPFTQRLRDRYNHLESQRHTLLATIEDLDTIDANAPQRATTAHADLLDALPRLAVDLQNAHAGLVGRLFDLTQLTIRVHYETNEVTLQAVLPADYADEIAEVTASLSIAPATTSGGADESPGHAQCAPRQCPQSDSNRHSMDFKSTASANWAMGAFGTAYRVVRVYRNSDRSSCATCRSAPGECRAIDQ